MLNQNLVGFRMTVSVRKKSDITVLQSEAAQKLVPYQTGYRRGNDTETRSYERDPPSRNESHS